MVTSKMLDNNIGYVAVYEFEETTSEQFNQAIDALTAQGMKGLIIDLRDNPGGLVNSATAILDRILSKDQLLVYTVDKNGKKQEEYTEDDENINVPISVLINGNSASASEIVSGCLQDYGKAKLVGTTSFGKGIVQYVLPLGDGSAIKLTSAKYYTPNGRNIHGTGIDPDVEVELNSDSETDTQLEKAQEIVLQEEFQQEVKRYSGLGTLYGLYRALGRPGMRSRKERSRTTVCPIRQARSIVTSTRSISAAARSWTTRNWETIRTA